MNDGQQIISTARSRALRATLACGLLLTILAACGSQPATSNTSTTTEQSVTDAAAPTDATTEGTRAAEARTAKTRVVATFSILGDLVANVGGDVIDLRTLVPAGSDAHTFEPSPADSVALVDAAVIFENGLEFESWLPDLYASSRSTARRVVVTEGIDPIAAEGHAEEGHEEEHDEHTDETATAGNDEHTDEIAPAGGEAEHDEHGEYDPHTWHNVQNVIVMVGHIRDGLTAADPNNAATYQRNATTYIEQLEALDKDVVAAVEKLPMERRKLVTTHDAFAYFANRYGFEIVGTALGSVSTEVADPSAAELVQLVDQIEATGVGAIFAENVGNESLMQRVANEAGVQLGPPLYTDALSEPGTEGDTYLKMIRYNIDAIVTTLSS